MSVSTVLKPAAGTPAARTRLDLPTLLDGAAQAFPNRPAVGDAAPRRELDGAEPRRLTLGELRREAERLAGLFGQFRLSPGASVAIQLPNVPEAMLAIMGVLRAGLCPLLLPAGLSRIAATRAIADGQCEGIVTATRAGSLKPGEVMRDIAGGNLTIRFVTAFGEDLPDGLIGLDRLPWSLADAAAPLDRDHGPDYGLVATLDEASGQIFARSCESLIATGLGIVAAARMRPGHRVLSLLPPDDLAGLAAGLLPSLAAGVPLTTMGLFDSAALAACLDEGQPTHLIAPGWLEPSLAGSRLGRHPSLAGIVYVHKLPWAHRDERGPETLAVPCVDILAVGEYALFITQRETGEGPRFDINGVAPRLPSGHALVEARAADGMLEVRGRAARSRTLQPLGRREPDYAMPADRWMQVPMAIETEGTLITGLDRLQRSF